MTWHGSLPEVPATHCARPPSQECPCAPCPGPVTYYVDHEAHRSLVQRQIPLLSGGTIPAGQHLLPFRITLLNPLPATFKHSKTALGNLGKEEAFK